MIVVRRNKSTPFITKDGSEIRAILDRTNAPVRNQSLAEATLPPGGATEGHRHPSTEEFYYVLSGRGSITVEDETQELATSEGVLIPPGSYHRLVNTGRGPLVFLCCCSPPYSDDDTVMQR